MRACGWRAKLAGERFGEEGASRACATDESRSRPEGFSTRSAVRRVRAFFSTLRARPAEARRTIGGGAIGRRRSAGP